MLVGLIRIQSPYFPCGQYLEQEADAAISKPFPSQLRHQSLVVLNCFSTGSGQQLLNGAHISNVRARTGCRTQGVVRARVCRPASNACCVALMRIGLHPHHIHACCRLWSPGDDGMLAERDALHVPAHVTTRLTGAALQNGAPLTSRNRGWSR
eukprot:364825-Chlamydomonas_euryale.AAC.9